MIAETRLREIVGRSLSAVAFVHDYVELHFDGMILRALTAPRVCGLDRAVTFPQQGSRDSLCKLIGKNVVDVVVRASVEIEVRFGEAESIQVPLSIDAKSGPEAVHFVPGDNQPIEVW